MSNKILFVTANFGINDRIPICKRFGKHDFIMFTDNAKKYENSIWSIKEFDQNFHDDEKINNILKNRYVKFQLHHIIDISQYALIVYCDGYMFPKKSEVWLKYSNFAKKNGIVQQLHKRNIYDECEAIYNCKKDTKENMEKLKNYFKSLNIPSSIKMYENTAFCYNPSNENVKNVMNDFWNLYTSLNITYRDQPLWAYMMYKNNMNPHIVKKLFLQFSKVKVNHKYVKTA